MSRAKVPATDELDSIARSLELRPDGTVVWRTASGRRSAGCLAGTLGRDGYVEVKINKSRHKAHRIAWYLHYGVWPVAWLDHVNSNRTDNRISNLREASSLQNARNRKSYTGKSSGYKGVSWSKRNSRFVAKIVVNGKQIHLGYHKDEELASLIYEEASLKYFGEFSASR